MTELRLKWNNFPMTVSSSLESLRSRGDLVDTSLWCEGFHFKAHRVVLSACSHYFCKIFKEVSSPNSTVAIVLSNIPHQDIDAILKFVYVGEVCLSEPQLASFLRTAETLQIKGLGQECSPLSSGSRPSSENAQETQFLATALQKPTAVKGKQGQTTPTPPLLSAYPPALTPLSTTPSLPSIDLGLAISNFTSNAAHSSNTSEATSSRKRKLMEQIDTSCKSMDVEERKRGEHLLMTDMTPPSSITNEEPHDSNPQHRQDPLAIPSGRTEILRPYQSQCRGERPRNARVPYCPHCGEDCHNISVLRYHVKTTHSEPSGCLCCCFCNAIFNLHSSTEYKQHTLDTHGVKYT